MKEKIYSLVPNVFQNIMITVYNIIAYNKRYGKNYKYHKTEYLSNKNLSIQELKQIQQKRYSTFIKYAIKNSVFYADSLKNITNVDAIENISKLPIVSKEVIRKNIESIYTIKPEQGKISKTGGTTGKSLKVLFTLDNMQERFAMLDVFREEFGYATGVKTAWFSGKHLLTSKDIRKNRFWKTDVYYNVRYYSTFHIKEDYLKYYLENLIKYQPKFLVGFPSSIADIARYGFKHNIDFPANTIKGIFPTAETITAEIRKLIESYFKTNIYNQYASSEGAPFIFECINKKLHLELQSGVFEVLDENNIPTNEGRLILTSFSTQGTPLIRYDIGDRLKLSSGICNCGNNNPLVDEILGRIDDYIYSPENGKINLGNVSNTLKDIKGVIRFQAIQDTLDSILIKVETDKDLYNKEVENKFIQNWKDRVGDKMEITLEYIDDIPVEKSGKFRMVKNNIKHLIP